MTGRTAEDFISSVCGLRRSAWRAVHSHWSATNSSGADSVPVGDRLPRRPDTKLTNRRTHGGPCSWKPIAPAPREHEKHRQASRPCHIPETTHSALREYSSLPTILIPITRERRQFLRRITQATFPNISAFCANDQVPARLGLMGTGEVSGSRLCGQSMLSLGAFLGRVSEILCPGQFPSLPPQLAKSLYFKDGPVKGYGLVAFPKPGIH